MTRTGTDAISYARGRIGTGPPPPSGMPDSGLCLAFTREPFAVPAVYASAIDAWYACNAPHPGDWNPPPAVPVWFRSPSVYDHVAFYVGPGEVISTYNDDVRAFDGLAGIEQAFDAQYLGWGQDINEVTVWTPDAPPPEPPPEPRRKLDDVTAIIRSVDTLEVAYLSDSGVITPAYDVAEAYALGVALRLPTPWVDLDAYQWTRVHQAAERILGNHQAASQ